MRGPTSQHVANLLNNFSTLCTKGFSHVGFGYTTLPPIQHELYDTVHAEKSELGSAAVQKGSDFWALELRCFNDYEKSEGSPLSMDEIVEGREEYLGLMELNVDMPWPDSQADKNASLAKSTSTAEVCLTAQQKCCLPTSIRTLREDPAHLLSSLRNLRRLTIYTCVTHLVELEGCDTTHARISTAVHEWLRTLLAKKQGAPFEKVVIHARTKRVNEAVGPDAWTSKSTYKYEGKEDSSGVPEIVEGQIVCLC